MNNREAIEKLRLKVNIGIFIYFCLLIGIYIFKVEAKIVQVLGELLTIPALLALISIPIWALVDNLRKKNSNASIYVLTLLVTLLTFILLFISNSYLK